jgi:hypothetical protein
MPVGLSRLLLLDKKEKFIVFPGQNSFCSSQKITKKYTQKSAQRYLQEVPCKVQDPSIKALFYSVTVTFG